MSCNTAEQPAYCTSPSPELKLYQAFIFSVPVFFTFLLLLLFCVFYLRRRRANWQSLRMRDTQFNRRQGPRALASGIKKEVREMLPVVVFKESFLIRETLCSVCLGDYQSDERLQRIPTCGHTFHVDCIDHWLATPTTCPLCRLSLLPPAKPASDDRLHYEAQDSEGQLQQQSAETSTELRISPMENEAEERERASGTTESVDSVREERSYEEGSVVIDVENHSSSEET